MRPARDNQGVSFTLLQSHGLYIFQHRDNLPSISSPGLFAAFGGAIEGNEEPRHAAARELAEETSLKIDQQDLLFLGSIDSPEVSGGLRYVFKGMIDSDDFDVKEGQGKVAFTRRQ